MNTSNAVNQSVRPTRPGVKSMTVAMLSTLLMSACVTPPPQRVMSGPPQPPAPPQTQVMVYPARGQTPEQQERDRYECHVWAVQQTGFDPSAPGVPSNQRVVVQPANPPGSGTAVGAIAGAILGAVIGGPRNAGAGLLIGGITGAAVGTASDANAQAQADYEQQRLDAGYSASQAQGAQRATNYRRAVTACLDARGYTTA
jgi:Glycine zipper 2TM domain